MTQITSTSTSTRTPTRASCTCEHGTKSALFRRHTLMHLMAQVVLESSPHLHNHTWASLLDLFDLPFNVNLSFPVFFHSSVLMHPEPHTDLDNLNTVQHNLRHSAKGSNDAYDVTDSLTSVASGPLPCSLEEVVHSTNCSSIRSESHPCGVNLTTSKFSSETRGTGQHHLDLSPGLSAAHARRCAVAIVQTKPIPPRLSLSGLKSLAHAQKSVVAQSFTARKAKAFRSPDDTKC